MTWSNGALVDDQGVGYVRTNHCTPFLTLPPTRRGPSVNTAYGGLSGCLDLRKSRMGHRNCAVCGIAQARGTHHAYFAGMSIPVTPVTFFFRVALVVLGEQHVSKCAVTQYVSRQRRHTKRGKAVQTKEKQKRGEYFWKKMVLKGLSDADMI